MRIFVGSTYTDLHRHRSAVIDALKKLRVWIDAMELWYAGPQDPLATCLTRVETADVYVLLVGYRYGSTKRFRSFIQHEYETAHRSRKQCLVFMMRADEPVLPRYVDTGLQARLLERFKKRLRRNHFVQEFGSADDVAHKVVESVRRLMAQNGDPQAENLDLNKFWASLKSTWERVSPPELRIDLNTSDDIAELFEKVEDELRGIERFRDHIQESHDRLLMDGAELLARVGLDPGLLDEVPYYENPLINRDGELLMLFPNRVLACRVFLAQARVRVLEELIRRGGRPDLDADLTEARQSLTNLASKVRWD